MYEENKSKPKSFKFSSNSHSQGGTPITEFPKIYTDPRLVIGTRDRTRERWRSPPNYRMINYSSDLTNRNQDIQKMNEVSNPLIHVSLGAFYFKTRIR